MSSGTGAKPAAAEPVPAQEAEPKPAPRPFEPIGPGSRSQGKSGLFDIPIPGGGPGGLLPRAPLGPKGPETDDATKPAVKPGPRDKKV